MISSERDRPELESGYYVGSTDALYSAPPVKVDKTVSDGEYVELGNIVLKANVTPGHTPGCTSWSTDIKEHNARYSVLFFCSASVAGNRLVDPPQYEGIVEDYRRTFETTKDWQPDILLGNHPIFFDMESKRAEQKSGNRFAFIDRQTFPTLMEKLHADFEKKLKAQTLDARKGSS